MIAGFGKVTFDCA